MSDRLILDLRFPPLSADLANAVVHLTVEDVGEADAPARVLFERDFTHIRVSREDRTVRIECDLPDLRGAVRPAIRLHVDTSGTGTITPGDFINPAIVDVSSGVRRTGLIELVQVR
jgi:putative lipoprotein